MKTKNEFSTMLVLIAALIAISVGLVVMINDEPDSNVPSLGGREESASSFKRSLSYGIEYETSTSRAKSSAKSLKTKMQSFASLVVQPEISVGKKIVAKVEAASIPEAAQTRTVEVHGKLDGKTFELRFKVPERADGVTLALTKQDTGRTVRIPLYGIEGLQDDQIIRLDIDSQHPGEFTQGVVQGHRLPGSTRLYE